MYKCINAVSLYVQCVINAPWYGSNRVDDALDITLWQRCNAAIFGSVATHPRVVDRALSTRAPHVGTALVTHPR